MVSVAAASGLLTATSVSIVATSFAWDRTRVLNANIARGMLISWFVFSFTVSLACLHATARSELPMWDVVSSDLLFDVGTALTGFFPILLVIVLYPKKVERFFE
jgi:hypothetical protein